MHVLTMGGVSCDLIFELPEALCPPKKVVIANEFAIHPGGKAFNMAVVLRRLFNTLDVDVLAALGGDHDLFSNWLRGKVQEAGIGTRYLQIKPQMTSPIVGILHFPDALVAGHITSTLPYEATGRSLDSSHLDQVDFAECDAVLATGEINMEITLDAFARLKAANPRAIAIFNPAPAEHFGERFRALDFQHVDYLFLNLHEVGVFLGQSVADDAVDDAAALAIVRQLKQITAIPHICLTLGDQGGWLCSPTQSIHFGAFQIDNFLNAVGAGDTFLAAFIGALLLENSPEQALQYASAAAATACMDQAAVGEHVTAAQIAQLLASAAPTWSAHHHPPI
jgi:ribokinase